MAISVLRGTAVGALVLLASAGVMAQEGAAPGVDPTPPGVETAPAPAPAPAEDEDEAPAPHASDKIVADAEQSSSPVELPNQTYYFLGARYRAVVVPKFIINLFGDGGRTVLVHSGGPEFGIRKNGFEYSMALTYADYGMDPTAFKASSDPEQAWEIVESRMKIVYFTTDFLWSSEFSPEFALNYGFGVGLGLVFGDLQREQAYKDASTGGKYVPCTAPGVPDVNGYCGDDNDHYNKYKEPSWLDGGDKPFVFPWLGLQTGLRYKPARQFATRVDLGFGLSGFFAGIGLDYGL